jgi:hypothetical protein
MAEKIKLVQGDTRPYIKATLRDADGTAINVQGATVRFKFRASGDATTLFTVVCSKPNNGVDGLVMFNFPTGSLLVDPGNYEGELEIDYGGNDIQTVYDLLKFSVRAQFS